MNMIYVACKHARFVWKLTATRDWLHTTTIAIIKVSNVHTRTKELFIHLTLDSRRHGSVIEILTVY